VTPSELLVRFREDVADEAEPYLWSDQWVLDSIADAEDMWCRLTDGISDGTTDEATLIEVVADTDWYDTHPSLLLIRSAIREDTGEPIEVLNYEDMATRGIRFNGDTGKPRALIWGIEDNKVRIWPVPDETVDVRLTVFRRPLEVTGEDAQFVIPSQYHLHLVQWVKHLAYLKEDNETFNRTRAKEQGDAFRAFCEEVKAEQRRKRHKTRVVAYGGI
jgi:hypothetical protein